MVYLATAYAVFWAVTFVLVFSIHYRQRKLQAALESLQRALEEKRRETGDA